MVVSGLIIAKNEERHIRSAITSLRPICSDILVIDDYSTDGTVRVATRAGARVIHHRFASYASQINFGLQALSQSEWVIRLDADEIMDESQNKKLSELLSRSSPSISMYAVRRSFVFQGKLLRWGGVYRKPVFRIVRPGRVSCYERSVDEFFISEGGAIKTDIDIYDCSKIGFDEWLLKHIRYSCLEFSEESRDTNRIKKFYYALPLFFRAIGYFVFRYFVCLGFLDGKKGFIFHVFQCLVYRLIIDSKIVLEDD